MSEEEQMLDLELSAFIDGELDAERRAAIAARIAGDPALAERVAQYQADQARLARLFAPLADQPLPAALVRAVETSHVRHRRNRPPLPWGRRLGWGAALAASLVCAWLVAAHFLGPDADWMVADALAARSGVVSPARQYAAGTLGAAADRDKLLQDALALPVKLPDLGKAGYALTGIDLYKDGQNRSAVQLSYRDGGGRLFTVYLHPAAGPDRFELLTRGQARICVWENEELGAVMVGEMSSPEMLRVASLTYADLNF
jgi:anti-sigma factor RsiW